MKFYVTTPIYYVNDVPTVGHAYTTIACDVVARYYRLRGDDVLFTTGTDENALKVVRAAEARGLEPKPFVSQMADDFRREWLGLNIAYDDFIRTTEDRHRRAVQAFFEKLHASGDLYLDKYEGWYCVSDETFFREEELVEGRCPNPECGRKAEWIEEPAYFFRFSNYSDRLLEYIEDNPGFLLPEFRKNEVVNFIRGGLRDACVSRQSSWGIPLPASIPESEGHVIYVWADALINYLTCAGYPDDIARFEQYWPADVHIMAKDIFVRFHATLWPAMLMAAELPLPRCIVAHGWWTQAGEKISKSRGGAIPRPGPVLDAVIAETRCSREAAVDALRYHMLREVPFGLDGEFSVEALLGRYADDLANDLGNLLHRVLPMIARYREGRVPSSCPPDPDLHPAAQSAAAAWETAVETLDFRSGLAAIWSFLRAANRFIDQQAPWALAKSGDQQALDRVLYSAAEAIRIAAVLVAPVMPNTADEIEAQLGLRGWRRSWDQAHEWGLVPAGQQIGRPTPLFPRQDQGGKAAAKAAGSPNTTRSREMPVISIKEFQKIDLRVGEVIGAEAVPGADKLLKLTVDIGDEQRTMVAGVALSYRPEDLVGKKVVVVTNLEPATIRGVRSEGMILAGWVQCDDKSIAIVTHDRSLPKGARVT
ncbi:MAG: methionine--tRNA ligase [Armatimonadota bacterium]|nr:MAG: methionine--tRNA ligase [Armatimonadota bacterium]